MTEGLTKRTNIKRIETKANKKTIYPKLIQLTIYYLLGAIEYEEVIRFEIVFTLL